VLVALGIGVFAGRATFIPPQVGVEAPPLALFTVAEATVGSSVTLTVTAKWPVTPLSAGSSAGTVTSIAIDNGAVVESGTVAYTVDLRPVVIAEGVTPTFRDLVGGESGADVRQLQQMLAAGGYFTGQVNGVYGTSTTQAVSRWQRALGVERTGEVARGDVLFVPGLPARLTLSADVVVGAQLTPEQTVVSAVASTPEFAIVVSGNMQQNLIPHTGETIDVEPTEDTRWSATVTGSTTDSSGQTVLTLAGVDGQPVCGDQCESLVPFTGEDRTFPGRVVTVPEVTGPAVPPAAVGTAADGSRFVVRVDGTRVPVTVVAADASRVVVDGVEVGDVVQLFSSPADSPAAPGGMPAESPDGSQGTSDGDD
jgi:peptidoglycan hydrolase-like protein with peptidoglycan-binding domain